MSIWCYDCKNYICEGSCMYGQNTEENYGICIFFEDEDEEDYLYD